MGVSHDQLAITESSSSSGAPPHGPVDDVSNSAANETARTRFLANVTTNIMYLVLNTGIMFWYVPFLISHLGISAYGIIALVNSIIGYAANLADGMSTISLRFLSIGLTQGNQTLANRAFNSSVVTTIIFSALATPIFLGITLWFPELFQVPRSLETESRILFALIAGDFVLTLVGSSFNATALALHRFDLHNLVQTITMLVRVGVVVALFRLTMPAPWQIGLGFLLSGSVSLAAGWLIYRWITPALRLDFRQVNASQVREMAGLGGWMAMLRIGLILLQGTSLIVINFAFGSEATGRYGALLLIVEALQLLGFTVASVLSPAIMSRNATSEKESVRALAEKSSKMIGLLIALPVGLVCGLSGPILLQWLGPRFVSDSIALTLMAAPIVVNVSILPMAYVLVSRADIRWHSSTTLVLGLLNVFFSLAIATSTGLGIAGVAGVNALLSVVNSMLTATYCALALGLRWPSLYRNSLIPVVHAALLGVSCYFIVSMLHPGGLIGLALLVAGSSFIYICLVWLVSLTRDDRASLLALLPVRVQGWIGTMRGGFV